VLVKSFKEWNKSKVTVLATTVEQDTLFEQVAISDSSIWEDKMEME